MGGGRHEKSRNSRYLREREKRLLVGDRGGEGGRFEVEGELSLPGYNVKLDAHHSQSGVAQQLQVVHACHH